ncbi:MAG: hypothetical protein ACLFR2_01055 [Candidatus Kapaibacterium sp.]
MTYLDVISKGISEVTEIPQDFVKDHFDSYTKTNTDEKKNLVKMVFKSPLREEDASIILDRIREGGMKEVFMFLAKSIKQYQFEIHKRTIMN